MGALHTCGHEDWFGAKWPPYMVTLEGVLPGKKPTICLTQCRLA